MTLLPLKNGKLRLPDPTQGKVDFTKALEGMAAPEPFELEIENIITHGRSASVNGAMRSDDGKTYALCDIYQFNGFKKAKVKEMIFV